MPLSNPLPRALPGVYSLVLTAACLVLLAAACLIPGCRSSGCRLSEQKKGESPTSRLPEDRNYRGERQLVFHRIVFLLCARPAPSGVDRKLRPTAREALERLRRTSCAKVVTYVRPDRAVVRLPGHISRGLKLEAVLRAGQGKSAVVQRERRKFWWAEPAHLVDLLEGGTELERREATVRFLDAKPGGPMLPQKFATTRLEAVAKWKTTGPGERRGCDTRLAFTVWHSAHPSLPVKAGRMLINLALMTLGGAHGWDALREVRSRVGFPLKWQLSARCREWPAHRAPVTMHAEVLPGPVGSPCSEARLPANRAQLPPKGFKRRFGPLPGAGRQEVGAKAMRRIRANHAPPSQPGPGKLRVRNLSHRFVFVVLDGFRLGSVPADTTFQFQHMPPGYYRASAHTPWFTGSWGPRDLYLPGTWTIKN